MKGILKSLFIFFFLLLYSCASETPVLLSASHDKHLIPEEIAEDFLNSIIVVDRKYVRKTDAGLLSQEDVSYFNGNKCLFKKGFVSSINQYSGFKRNAYNSSFYNAAKINSVFYGTDSFVSIHNNPAEKTVGIQFRGQHPNYCYVVFRLGDEPEQRLFNKTVTALESLGVKRGN